MSGKVLFSRRLYIVAGFLVLITLLVIVRLFFIQVLKNQQFTREAERQYIAPNHAMFDRGTISFQRRDGILVSAATTQTGFKIALQPNRITDADAVYNALAPLITLDEALFREKIAKTNDPYEEIATRVPKEIADKIIALKLSGVQAVRENWRFYPAGDLASQVVGFIGFQGDTLAGRYGLERMYETALARTDEKLFVNFFADVFAEIKSAIASESDGTGNVVMTIDPSVQVFLEEELEKTRVRWQSDHIGGLIMDPHTGAILAMGISPTFDLNAYGSVTSPDVYKNSLVESVFEVGSIMKPIIMAIALEAEVVTPETMYTDAGSVKVGNATIYNFDRKARGRVTLQEFLNQSLNTGAVFVQQKIPKDMFQSKLRAFGFGEKTGIDLPGELSGLTKNLDTKRDVEYANIAFGQGIAVTPIAMTRALSALGNGGLLVSPHVVDRIDGAGNTGDDREHPEPRVVLTPEASEEITRMLVRVYDGYGDGKYKIPHYSVAGKTGTAQIANQAGGYYEDRNLHSFFGYLPAYDPKFIVYIFNEYPKNGAEFASQTLIEPFRNTAQFLISYYDVPPDRE